MDSDVLTVRIIPSPEGEPEEELALLTTSLRSELLELDVVSVDPVTEQTAPDRAKGFATLLGWLTVVLGAADRLRAVVIALRSWVAHTDRTIEVSYANDVLKLSHATVEQQERIVSDWLARHESV